MRSYVAYKHQSKWIVAPYSETVEHMAVEELKEYINDKCVMVVDNLDEVGSYEDTLIKIWSPYNDNLVFYI